MAPACCEKSPCAALCRGLACFASRDVTANRRAVVKTLVGIHVCCVVVAVVACLGALETKALKSTAWASVTMDTVGGPNGALYVGFRGVWVDGPGARNGSAPSPIDGYYAWDDFEDLVPSDESGGVEDCAAASTGLFSTSVGAASLLPSMNALLARSDAARDGGCNKFLSVVPSFLGAASTIAALRSFRADCFDGFPSTLANGTRTYASLDKKLGYGFGCELAVACVGVFTAAVMLFLGTAEPEAARVIPSGAGRRRRRRAPCGVVRAARPRVGRAPGARGRAGARAAAPAPGASQVMDVDEYGGRARLDEPARHLPLLLRAAPRGDLDVASPGAARAVVERTRKLRRFKSAGDRLLIVLFGVHGLCIAYVLFHVLWDTIDDGGAQLWYEIGISEGLNFFVWFLKMFPLFFLLFPVDRAVWFQGGALGDYALCRRSLAAYRRSPRFLDASFPRCVEPETRQVHEARLSTFFDELFQREYNLSTFAHSDKGLRDHCATPRDDLAAAPTQHAANAASAMAAAEIRSAPTRSLRRRDGLIQFARDETSQNGEDGVIAAIFACLDKRQRPKTRWCVDVGAWDGVHLSNTHTLLTAGGWRGALLEADAERCAKLRELHAPLGNVAIEAFVSCVDASRSVESLLRKHAKSVPLGVDLPRADAAREGSSLAALVELKKHGYHLAETTPSTFFVDGPRGRLVADGLLRPTTTSTACTR
ncbi:hypothetical protein JL721_5963 [Aureococcus anophagefferens]|nr:hypothetical protein JL721_5963 [Aureococcus anophagefferens]